MYRGYLHYMTGTVIMLEIIEHACNYTVIIYIYAYVAMHTIICNY